MKKTLYSVMAALALCASPIALTSCEDVPEPYNIPTANNTATATGTGTASDPFNVAGAVKYIADGGSESTDMYVKGKVVSVTAGSYDASYGSLKYYISDDGTSTNQFYVYNGYAAANRTKFKGESDLKQGDEVIICGKLITYNNTKEFQTGNYIYSLNGVLTGEEAKPDTPSTGEATGDGTLANPYNYIAAANLANSLGDNEQSGEVYIKGKVSSIKEEYNTSFGNGTFYITDDGSSNDNQFYVYRALYLGNKQYASGNTQIKVGDEVVICGKVTKYVSSYGTTLETAQKEAYLYSLNGKTTDEGGTEGSVDPTPSTGEGSYTSPYNVTSAKAAASGTGVYLKAYIVGCINDKSISTASFDASNMTSQTNFVVAASADETNINNCLPVQLPSGAIRSSLNLKDNPSNLKQEVLLYGNIEKYFGVTGFKSVTYAELNGTSIGTKP